MRIITQAELPENYQSCVLIKCGERNRRRRSADAIEHMLNHCKAIYAEYDTAKLRAQSEIEGFSAGFQQYFAKILSMLMEYERLQNQRFNQFRQGLIDSVKSSLQDPVIVEILCSHLQQYQDEREELTLILPAEVTIPPSLTGIKCIRTEDNQISLQSGTHTTRFPIDSLCKQWLNASDAEVLTVNKKIKTIIPKVLNSIAEELSEFK